MIRLLVDSASDYTLAELEERNIEMAPLTVTLSGKTYLDNIELERNCLYEMLENTTDFPKTSQPSPSYFETIFQDAKEKGDSVICVLLSSGLSGTCQSAHLAKNIVDYGNIYIIDSLNATIAVKLLADYVDDLRKQDLPVAEIIDKAEALRPRIRLFAAIDTLDYLQRGGRISKAAAAIGTLANLKPLITFTEEGTLTIPAKCIGRNKANAALIKFTEEYPIDTDYPVYPIYTYGRENCEKFVAKCEKEGIHCCEIHQVGSTIGSHIGSGAYGIVYVQKM